ncbi:MAG: hypothetical protein ABEJ87_00600 [Candidatus Nanohalobium sp.]
MSLKDSLVTFAVGLVVGAIGIHVGALLVLGTSQFPHAATTAVLGAVVWFLASHFFGWVPFLGIVLTFITWLGVINGRYPGGMMTAAKIALVAWAASVTVDYFLKYIGIRRAHAVGVPEA